jgi:hypothetical protein
MDEWMDVKGNYWRRGTYHNTLFGFISIKGRDLKNFLIHFNKLLMDESLDG